MENVLFAFALTLAAGVATSLGGLIAILGGGGRSKRFLAAALGFSGGVMIYISLVEILPKAADSLAEEHSSEAASWMAAGAFFAGIAVVAIIDRLVPDTVNPHEVPGDIHEERPRERALLRMGTFTAVAIAVHNFPEGFATFVSGLQDPQIAVPIAVAIAIHNVPEGIAVAAPVHHATGSRGRALTLATLAGLAEPAGALIGFVLLAPFITPTLFGLVFAAVAGIMVFISFDELLPTAQRSGHHHHAVYGLIAGMAVMAASLLLMM